MTTLPKILLAISATAFAAGLTDVGSSIGWGVLRPLSAVFFILFLITKFLEKEVDLYDEETRLRTAQPALDSARPSAASRNNSSSGKAGNNGALTTAHSH